MSSSSSRQILHQNNTIPISVFQISENCGSSNNPDSIGPEDIFKILSRKYVIIIGLIIILLESVNIYARYELIYVPNKLGKINTYWYFIELTVGITILYLSRYPNVKYFCILNILLNLVGIISPILDFSLRIHNYDSLHYNTEIDHNKQVLNTANPTNISNFDHGIPFPDMRILIGINVIATVPPLLIMSNLSLIFISLCSLIKFEIIENVNPNSSSLFKREIFRSTGFTLLAMGFLSSIYYTTFPTLVPYSSHHVIRSGDTTTYFYIYGFYYVAGLLCLACVHSRSQCRVFLLITGIILSVINSIHMYTIWRFYSRADQQETILMDNCIQNNELCISVCNNDQYYCNTHCTPVNKMCDGYLDYFIFRRNQQIGIGCEYSRDQKWNPNNFYFYWPGVEEMYCNHKWMGFHSGAFLIGIIGYICSIILIFYTRI